MSFEQSKGKTRLPRPRKSDVNDGTVPARLRGRDAKGRFEHGNDQATGRGGKRALLATLPDHDDAVTLYNAAVRQLVHDTPFARRNCARWVRCLLLEAQLAAEAAKVGIATDKGMALLELAATYGTKAEHAETAILTYTKRKTPTAKTTTGLAELKAKVEGGSA